MSTGKAKFKKLYSTKNYDNPYFQNKKNRGKREVGFKNFKLKLAIYLTILLFLTCFYYFFLSSKFSISSVKVAGAVKISGNEMENKAYSFIRQRRWLALSQKNIFIFNADKFKNIINSDYSLKNIEIIKNYPNQIIIKIQEKEHSLILVENGKYYYLNIDGSVIAEADPLEISTSDFPVIENYTDKKISGHKISELDAQLEFINKFFNIYKENSLGLSLDKFLIDENSMDISVVVKDAPIIIFRATEDTDAQLNKLSALLQDRFKNDFSSKQHIDLRFGDKVYYK